MLMATEAKGSGLQWSNLFSRARPEDPLTMGAVWIMFLVDIVVYSLIIAYIDKIAPGKYGVAKKWYFPFTKEFWLGSKGGSKVVIVEDKSEIKDISMFEPEQDAKPGIRVTNLRKQFTTVINHGLYNCLKLCSLVW